MPRIGGLHVLGCSPPFTYHASRVTHKASRIISAAFTLIELLLVMAIMIAALSVTAPTLANFFRGRSLDSEARQLLALTHAGESRAVYEGVPILLWVDTDARTYGLKEEPGWIDHDPKAVDFTLDKDLHLELVKAGTPKPRTSAFTGMSSDIQQRANPGNLPEIRFMPDGTVDDNSPAVLRLYDRDNASRYLILATNRANYEIRSKYAQ